MKKLTVSQKRLKYIKEKQTMAKRYINDLAKKGYIVQDKAIINAIEKQFTKDDLTGKGSKKAYESMKSSLSLRNIKRHATYAIPHFRKQSLINDVYKYDNETLYDPATGDIKAVISSGISMEAKERIDKNSARGNKDVANILNDLLYEQRERFKTADAQLYKTIWKIAVKMNGDNDPQTSSSNFIIEPYYDEDKKDFVEYVYDPNDEEKSMKSFYQAVRFVNVDTRLWHDVESEILSHPQTNPDLYEYYKKKAQDRSFLTNQKNYFNRIGEKIGVSPETAQRLVDLMNTSEIWYIAMRGAYDSEQVLDNWEHIYSDMLAIEKADNPNQQLIDSLRSKIENKDSSLNVKEVTEETKKILKGNVDNYINKENYYYNEGASKRWFDTYGHKDFRHSGSKYKRKRRK